MISGGKNKGLPEQGKVPFTTGNKEILKVGCLDQG